jgi:hypothetical protein
MDAGAPSLWGRVLLSGEGLGGVEVRGGESEEPDEAWSAWKPLQGFDGRGGAVALTARRVQVRVRLEGEEARLRSVVAVLRTPNHAPVVKEFRADHLGAGKDGEPPHADCRHRVSWKAEDPDGDGLRVRLDARRDGSPLWRPLVDGKVLERPEWEWDTTGWPDGTYALALEVDDAPANEAGRERRVRALLPRVRVDNTPPVVEVTAEDGDGEVVVRGEARDAAQGRVLWARVSVDGGEWGVLVPLDGLLDSDREGFRARVPVKGSGAHDVVVQVSDAHGNVGSAATVTR